MRDSQDALPSLNFSNDDMLERTGTRSTLSTGNNVGSPFRFRFLTVNLQNRIIIEIVHDSLSYIFFYLLKNKVKEHEGVIIGKV